MLVSFSSSNRFNWLRRLNMPVRFPIQVLQKIPYSPFVSAAQNLLENLARLGIHASECTNDKWKTEYCENASRLRAFVPRTGARPVGMDLPQAAWVRLNCLPTGVGQFYSSMHK